MINHWKTVLALKIPVWAPRTEPDLNTVNVADQLHDITSQLIIVEAAIDGLHIGDPQAYGLYLVIRRQIDHIKAISAQIHPEPEE